VIYDLVLSGASDDASVEKLAAAAARRGHATRVLEVGADPPAVTLDPRSGLLIWNGERVRARAAFLRPAYTSPLDQAGETRVAAWFATLWAWLSANLETRSFNRSMLWAAGNKPLALRAALGSGLAVPRTWVTNDLERVRRERENWAVKPVEGGTYCEDWREVASRHSEELATQPGIFQERLSYPEFRVFLVRDSVIAFKVESRCLDYRRDPAAEVSPVPYADVPAEIRNGLKRLARSLGLDFAAADFKWSSEQNRSVFLEINTAPMFAAFDDRAGGRLAECILDNLVGEQASRAAAQ